MPPAASGIAGGSLGQAVRAAPIFDRAVARAVAAMLMLVAGVVLLVPRPQTAFSGLAAPLAAGADAVAGRLPAGLGGQFLLGALLGVVWTPCTGPTLAAAVTLAAQSESVLRAATVMLAFGVGAVVPVLAVAYGSRRVLLGHRARLATLAAVGRPLIAVLLLVVGALAFTGGDKVVEAWMVEHMPEWLLDLTTRV